VAIRRPRDVLDIVRVMRRPGRRLEVYGAASQLLEWSSWTISVKQKSARARRDFSFGRTDKTCFYAGRIVERCPWRPELL
jgi:hypothetical protein